MKLMNESIPFTSSLCFNFSMKIHFVSQISMCDLSRNWDYELDDELMADLVQGIFFQSYSLDLEMSYFRGIFR